MIDRIKKKQKGFTIIELLVAMTITLVLMSIVAVLMSRAFGVRSRESSRTDALTSAQAALNVISREIANSGFGLAADDEDTVHDNGIVIADSGATKLRVRANFTNTNATTSDEGEDVSYYYDADSQSIVRHDATRNPLIYPATTFLVNRISSVSFLYYNYTASTSTFTTSTTPTSETARVQITVTVNLDAVQGQPGLQTVTLRSDVTLRNSDYMMSQY